MDIKDPPTIVNKIKNKDINSYNNLNENDDMQWIRDVKETMPFDEVMVNEKYNFVINNREVFLKQLRDCGVHALADSIDDVEYVTVVSTSKLTSPNIFCGDDKENHYDGEKWAVELRFELRDWHMSGHRWRFWVADTGDVSLTLRTKGSPPKALKESELDWFSDMNIDKIKVGAKFKSVKHLDFQTGDAGTFIIDEMRWNEKFPMHTEVKYNGVDYRGFKFSKWVRIKDFLRWLDDGIIMTIEDE